MLMGVRACLSEWTQVAMSGFREIIMKRTAIVFLLVATGLCVGCERDFYARQIVEHNTDSGKLLLNLTGTAEQLQKRNRIDDHRPMIMADGTNIDVWIIKAKRASGSVRGTALLLHGLTESKAKYLRAGENLAKMGYDVVLPDLRAHGRSSGKYVTYGALEKLDVKAVMDELVGTGRVNKDVYVFGVNLGAATAIQYAAIDARVRGVLALTAYKDASSIARRGIALTAPTMSEQDFDEVLARAGEMANFDPQKASSEIAAMTLSCPLLLVHGLIDVSVPLEHSKAIYDAAAGPKKLMVVTPGPEQLALAVILDRWIAEKIDYIATTGLKDEPVTPTSAPSTRPAAKT